MGLGRPMVCKGYNDAITDTRGTPFFQLLVLSSIHEVLESDRMIMVCAHHRSAPREGVHFTPNYAAFMTL